ncbi:unnamed protein product [Cylindrotheca closterium]|uniref:Uncharacterized protein n=1 Tax=Cylindrotheca closterium TaxID=2856 RepID=A0AAD2FQC9_9STRA|nr:unnamed protein product [Cylindrotheca closterium]
MPRFNEEIALEPDEDLFATIIDFQSNAEINASKPCSTPAPVSNDDESISDTSTFSALSFLDPAGEEELSIEDSGDSPPPVEHMLSKLNSMMMRSNLSRAIISKNVFPDFSIKETKISFDYYPPNSPTGTTKSNFHKASPSASKHTRRTHDKISTDFVRLGSRQDSSIGEFLRASKKW